MDFQEIIDFANANNTCYLATVEGDQPRVRALGMWFADKTGFYFQTESAKALPKQLEKNNKVELCFLGEKMKMLRVSGKTQFVTDKALRKRILAERKFLQDFIKTPDDPLLVLFKVYTGEAYLWTMANNMKEDKIKRVKF